MALPLVHHAARSARLVASSRSVVRRAAANQGGPGDYLRHGYRKVRLAHTNIVPDSTKEDESKRTGVKEEPSHGPPPPPLASKPSPELFSLSGRSVIVTGGARGMGLTVVQSLLESGAHVRAVDVLAEPEHAEWEHAQSLARRSGLALTYDHLDITDQAQVGSVFSELFASAPASAPVRGLFCSAGIQLMLSATDYSPEQFRKIVDVDLTGSFLCAQAFAREWIKLHPPSHSSAEAGTSSSTTPSPSSTSPTHRAEASAGPGESAARQDVPGKDTETGLAGEGGASIVMTASMSGSIANYGLECAAYNAAKAGVIQLGRNLAMEWGKRGIRVNTLSPGYIRTKLTADLLRQRPSLNDTWLQGSLLGRLSTPDEFRGPVIFLLSDASSFMTGADVIVDGGHTAT